MVLVKHDTVMDSANLSSNMFTSRKTYTFSRFTLIFSVAILICSCIGAGLLVLHFGTCKDNKLQFGENRIRKMLLDETIKKEQTFDLRLPRSVKPMKYDLELIPFLFGGNFTFKGEVKILVNVTETCRNITLHAFDLAIDPKDVSVRMVVPEKETTLRSAAAPLAIQKQYFVRPKQFYVIELADDLLAGAAYEIRIKYKGILSDQLQGFYRSSYNIGKETR